MAVDQTVVDVLMLVDVAIAEAMVVWSPAMILLEQEKNTRDFSHEMNFLADSKCIEKSVHSGEKSSNKET